MYGMVTSHSAAPTRGTSPRSVGEPHHHHHHHHHRSQSPGSCPRRAKPRSVYRRMVTLIKEAWTGVKRDDEEAHASSTDVGGRRKRRGIEALCRSTRFTREELQLLYRGFKQACPTGKVTEETLRDIYAKFFPQGDTSRYAHFVFNSFDLDRSGEITFEEFAVGLSALLRGSMQDKIGWTFNLYDVDHDGRITKDEMLSVVSSIYCLLGQGIAPKVDEDTARLHVDKVFQKLDLNKDGVVTLEEFVEVCTKDEAIRRAMCMFDAI